MVGVWAMSLWEQMGQPGKMNLVELGPGRGTLMADLLRVWKWPCSCLRFLFHAIEMEMRVTLWCCVGCVEV